MSFTRRDTHNDTPIGVSDNVSDTVTNVVYETSAKNSNDPVNDTNVAVDITASVVSNSDAKSNCDCEKCPTNLTTNDSFVNSNPVTHVSNMPNNRIDTTSDTIRDSDCDKPPNITVTSIPTNGVTIVSVTNDTLTPNNATGNSNTQKRNRTMLTLKVDSLSVVDTPSITPTGFLTWCPISGFMGDSDKGQGLEAVLSVLGPFGWYQRWVLGLLVLAGTLAPMYSLSYVFVAHEVPFRCLVPECDSSSPQYNNETVAPLLSDDQCRRKRALEQRSCDPVDYSDDTVPCQEYVYENHNTIFAEFNLACTEVWGRGGPAGLVWAARNLALALALIITGYISDRYGRLFAMCWMGACAGALSSLKSLASDVRAYAGFDFLEVALGHGYNTAAYIMLIELARPSLRAAFACASGIAYGVGGIIFAVVARQVPQWRELLRVTHLPALALPFYWLLLDESARWLLASNQLDKAVNVVTKAAQWNKVILDDQLVKESLEQIQQDCKGDVNPWLEVLRSRVLLLRLAACTWCWVVGVYAFYGLTADSVPLSKDTYTNFALNMAMEIVASLLMMMALERIGRRLTIIIAFVLCSLAAIVPLFASEWRGSRALYFTGRLAVSAVMSAVRVLTAESFPTSVRTSALAVAALSGRITNALAPYAALLSPPLQALLYALFSLSGALAVLLVPETRRAALPQSVQEAERARIRRTRSHGLSARPHPPPAPALTRIALNIT